MNMITQINNPLNHPFKKMVKPLYRFAIAILVPGLMLSATASAQDRTLTLDEAIKLGIQNSKVLKLSQSKIDQAVSSSLCCAHCRGKLRFGAHRYWHMRFCSAVCVNAYRQRLSPHTRQKIYEIDSSDRWKAAS